MWNKATRRRITVYQLAVVGLAILVTLWARASFVPGVVAGSVFAYFNFLGLRILIGRTLAQAGRKRLLCVLMLGFKTVFALAIIAILVLVLKIHPVAFFIGLVSSFVGLILGAADVALSRKTTTV